jgi:hypothetical protein
VDLAYTHQEKPYTTVLRAAAFPARITHSASS